jgi:hypothetical protein
MLAHGDAREEKGNLIERYMKSAQCKYKFEAVELEENSFAVPVCTPRLENSRCFIVTTCELWDSKFDSLAKFLEEVNEAAYLPKSKSGNKVSSQGEFILWYNIVISILVGDEVQIQNKPDSYTTTPRRANFIKPEQNKGIAYIFHSEALLTRGILDLARIIGSLIRLRKTQELRRHYKVLP